MSGSQPPDKSLYVLPESTLLVLVGGLDLVSTIYILATHTGHEANPLFVGLLDTFGVGGFIVFKALMLGIPLTIAELARRKHPEFVRSALRFGLAAYVLLYLVAFIQNNIH